VDYFKSRTGRRINPDGDDLNYWLDKTGKATCGSLVKSESDDSTVNCPFNICAAGSRARRSIFFSGVPSANRMPPVMKFLTPDVIFNYISLPRPFSM
jgi:hypothetical protein